MYVEDKFNNIDDKKCTLHALYYTILCCDYELCMCSVYSLYVGLLCIYYDVLYNINYVLCTI